MTETSKFILGVALVIGAILTLGGSESMAGDVTGVTSNNTLEQNVRLPQDCTPGQIAVATGTGDNYRWICGDLP